MRKPRIAYITPNAPLPANRGGRIRAHHLWRALSAFAEVRTLVLGDSATPTIRRQFRQSGAVYYPRRRYSVAALEHALAAGRPVVRPGLWEVQGAGGALPEELWAALEDGAALFTHALNPRRVERIVDWVRRLSPDLVVLCDASTGLLAPRLRALGVRIVVGPHNHDSSLYHSMAHHAPTDFLRRWCHAAGQAFEKAEAAFAPHVDQLWVCSRADAERFAGLVVPERIRVVPNVVDVEAPTPLPQSRDLVFVGQGNYFPNEDAIVRLFDISAALDARGVQHRLRIVGRVGADIRRRAARFPSVEVVGEVPLVAPFIEEATLAPVALTLGGGTRLKILEALAAARPVVSTPIGIEGIEAEDGIHAVIEPDLAAFPDRVAELLGDPARAQRIANAGWALARDRYSHERLRAIARDALADLGLTARADEPPATILAANLGADVSEERASFNPHTRLLQWSFLVRIAASFEALAGELEVAGFADLPNAFVMLKQRPRGLVAVECSAVLPQGAPPEAVSLLLFAWGRPALRRASPRDVPLEVAGLLALERAEGRLRVLAFAGADAEIIVPNVAPVRAPAVATRPAGVFSAEVPAPPIMDRLGITPAHGLGQVLDHANLWTAERLSSSARLGAMKDRHAGETAWLVGNGPSVRLEDLDALAGKLTFCFNRFHLAHSRTQLRATYTVTGDKQMIEDFGQQIVDESGGTVFVAHETAPQLLGPYIWLRQIAVYPPLFSFTPERAVSPGGSSVFVAMQVAFHMGVRRFYVYGADFSFSFERTRRAADNFRTASGDGNHFIPNYRSGRPWCPPSLRDIGAGFQVARRVIEAHGGFVRNATRGGLLEMFEREEFESAIAAS